MCEHMCANVLLSLLLSMYGLHVCAHLLFGIFLQSVCRVQPSNNVSLPLLLGCIQQDLRPST